MAVYSDQFLSRLDFPVRDSVEQFYVICSTGRCGSHMLGHLLHATGRLGFPLEYFNQRNLKHWRERFGTINLWDTYEQIKRHRTSPNGVFGCKVHFHQFYAIGKRFPMERLFPEAQYLLLTRRDLLGQAISYARASQTGQWISAVHSDIQPKYSKKKIERCLGMIVRENACWAYFFARHNVPHLHLVYEDVLADQAGTLKTISEFLGVDIPLVGSESGNSLPQKQRDELNAEWRNRFLHGTSGKSCARELRDLHEGAHRWRFRLRRGVARLVRTVVKPNRSNASISSDETCP